MIMKKLITVFLFCLFLPTVTHAYCNFEFVSMENNLNSLIHKLPGLDQNLDAGESPYEVKVSSQDICTDPQYKDMRLMFTFIENQLHHIELKDRNNKVDHLQNLIYQYGNPSTMQDNKGSSGIKYYHWDLSFRQVFLIIKFSQAESFTLIEITSDKYTQLMQDYHEDIQ